MVKQWRAKFDVACVLVLETISAGYQKAAFVLVSGTNSEATFQAFLFQVSTVSWTTATLLT